MRILEGLLLIITIVTIIFLTNHFYRRWKWSISIPFLLCAVFCFHIVFDGIRWQLYPLYLVIILCLALTLLQFIPTKKHRIFTQKLKLQKAIRYFMIIFVVASGVMAYIFPVSTMPTPPGNYEIGTQSFDLTDPVREAIYSDHLDQNRKIKIQIWYPVDTVKGYTQVPWLEDGTVVARALAKDMSLPSFALDQTALIKSNSYSMAPLSSKLSKYPVVVISHGWTGFRDIHADVAEELASTGYIVVGIDHTYGSEITVFNDGEISYLNRDALPDSETTPDFMSYASTLVSTYSGDVNLTLNSLEQFNNGEIDTMFKGKLDLSNLGLLGHSTGGGCDVSVALNDQRIKAIVGMDAWVEPIDTEEINKGLTIPALFLRSGQWEEGPNNKNLLNLIDSSSNSTYLYQINNTNHLDFSMVYMYSPLTKYMGLTGKLNGRISSTIQKDFIQNFFDKYLKHDTTIDIRNVALKWHEVTKIK